MPVRPTKAPIWQAGHTYKTPGAPGYTTVRHDDKAMQWSGNACSGVVRFLPRRAPGKKPGDHSFEIKTAFLDDQQIEHFWVGHLSFNGQNFQGQVDDAPHDIDSVRLGQSVTVVPREGTDWMFVKDGQSFRRLHQPV